MSSSPITYPPPAATQFRFVMLGWLCAAATISYVQRNCLSAVELDVSKELHLSRDEMGWVMSGFFFCYAVFQIPLGWVGDHWGGLRTLLVLVVVCSLAVGGMALAGGLVLILASRLLLGVGQAGLFPCSIALVRQWLPSRQHAAASGLLAAFMQVGGAVAFFLTTALLARGMDWRVILALYCLPGLAWAALRPWFRDEPAGHSRVNAAELAIIQVDFDPVPNNLNADRDVGATAVSVIAAERPDELPASDASWATVMLRPAMLALCLQQTLRAGGSVFFATWFPAYLRETQGVTAQQAGNLAALPFVAQGLGALLAGAVCDWLLAQTGSRRVSRQYVAIVTLVVCAMLVFAAGWVSSAATAVTLISLGTFCAALSGPSAYACAMDLGGRRPATVFATMNMCGNLGAMAFPVVAARINTATGSWELVMNLFVGIHLVAAVCWWFVDVDRWVVRPAPRGEESGETS